jgi:hypothetical protein
MFASNLKQNLFLGVESLRGTGGSCARIAVLAAITVSAATCPTASWADGPGWTVISKVVKVVVTGNGSINARLVPELNNCVSISGYGPNYASISAAHPGINRMKADILVAYVTGGPISFYFNDATCNIVESVLGGF